MENGQIFGQAPPQRALLYLPYFVSVNERNVSEMSRLNAQLQNVVNEMQVLLCI
jgi:hypothetical protein